MVLKKTYHSPDGKKPYDGLSDERLVEMYRSTANAGAIGALIDRYLHLVFGVCLKYLKQNERAEDAAMEILGRLLEVLKHHKIDNFSGWLYRVSKNHCLMMLRKKDPLIHAAPVDIHKINPEIFVEFDPELHLDHKEPDDLKALEFAMNQLNADQRRCLQLFYLENRSYKEIAEITGLDNKQVKSHIQNGKRNLKKELIRNGKFRT